MILFVCCFVVLSLYICAHLCLYVSRQVHSRTFAIVFNRVLFVVCSNYREDICLTSWLVLALLPEQLPFHHDVDNIFTVEFLVVLIRVGNNG